MHHVQFLVWGIGLEKGLLSMLEYQWLVGEDYLALAALLALLLMMMLQESQVESGVEMCLEY